MSRPVVSTLEAPLLLEAARDAGRRAHAPFAGELHPRDAWALLHGGEAILVDVRSAEERSFVGYVPGSLHLPWATGMALARNPRFVDQLQEMLDRNAVLLLLCRSGKRSALAAGAATQIGFANAFNVREGFEGELDEYGRRGRVDGWRFHGLPWIQN
ncbi:MAG TPA: rhodanese-like domain-containing protein [Burkholderiaceae bacterium]|nr:rhodanese-like domain-containing protein [Burkholderiaceae bacterium]